MKVMLLPCDVCSSLTILVPVVVVVCFAQHSPFLLQAKAGVGPGIAAWHRRDNRKSANLDFYAFQGKA